MQKNRQSCPHYLWSQLQMVHLETLPDLKRRRLWNKKIKNGRSIFNSKLTEGSTYWKKETVPGSGIEGPVLGGGGRLGGVVAEVAPPRPPVFFLNQFWILHQLVGGGQGTLGGSAGVGESLSPGRGARAGGDIPRDWAPELSWNNFF